MIELMKLNILNTEPTEIHRDKKIYYQIREDKLTTDFTDYTDLNF